MSDPNKRRDYDAYSNGGSKRRRDDDRSLEYPAPSRRRDEERDESRDRRSYHDREDNGYAAYGNGHRRESGEGGEYSRPISGDYGRGRRGGYGGERGYRGASGHRGHRGGGDGDYNRQSFSSARAGPSHAPEGNMPQQSESDFCAVFTSMKKKAPSSDGGSVRGGDKRNRITNDTVATKPSSVNVKQGKDGKEVTLTTNYFRMSSKGEMKIYQYVVDFEPEVQISAFKRGLLNEHKAFLGGYVFDGSTLYTTKKINDQFVLESAGFKTNEKYTITATCVRSVEMTTQEALQVFNIILRRSLDTLKLQLVGRNYYDPLAKIDMPDIGVQIWPGYVTSIRQHETDILLCAETSFKIMRTETVYDNLRRYMNEYGSEFKQKFKDFIIGSTVLTDYNNKTYNITDIEWQQNPSTKFETKKGPISFKEYYEKRYNIKIRDPNQPMLITKAKAREVRAGMTELIALIPELCRMTGITPAMRTDFRIMNKMAEHTRQVPSGRINKLLALNNRLTRHPECVGILEQFNLRLDTNLVSLKGRVLPPEKINTGNGELRYNQADWTKNLRDLAVLSEENLDNWCVICPRMIEQSVIEFVKTLKDMAKGLKFTIKDPNILSIASDRKDQIIFETDQCINKYKPQLILFVMTRNTTDTYSVIKKKCVVDRGVPSQVLIQKTMKKNAKSVATKVAIQMGCKIGVIPWKVSFPVTGLMTIGFDTNTDKGRRITYGALVATMDLKVCQKYYSTVSEHKGSEELSGHMANNVNKALRAYEKQHHSLPKRILIYRDGVGEGQLKYVHEMEVKNLVANLEERYAAIGQPLQLAVIVVNKKINTRFFKDKSNPGPGTVVDSVVTMPQRYDFFLISQNVNQGTVAPTSYNIIHDTIKLDPSQIQILTFKMCHLYYNWSGTTRVPGVCQLASKLAFLVGQYLKTAPTDIMSDQLYYL